MEQRIANPQPTAALRSDILDRAGMNLKAAGVSGKHQNRRPRRGHAEHHPARGISPNWECELGADHPERLVSTDFEGLQQTIEIMCVFQSGPARVKSVAVNMGLLVGRAASASAPLRSPAPGADPQIPEQDY